MHHVGDTDDGGIDAGRPQHLEVVAVGLVAVAAQPGEGPGQAIGADPQSAGSGLVRQRALLGRGQGVGGKAQPTCACRRRDRGQHAIFGSLGNPRRRPQGQGGAVAHRGEAKPHSVDWPATGQLGGVGFGVGDDGACGGPPCEVAAARFVELGGDANGGGDTGEAVARERDETKRTGWSSRRPGRCRTRHQQGWHEVPRRSSRRELLSRRNGLVLSSGHPRLTPPPWR